jgi:hypothetical protein
LFLLPFGCLTCFFHPLLLLSFRFIIWWIRQRLRIIIIIIIIIVVIVLIIISLMTIIIIIIPIGDGWCCLFWNVNIIFGLGDGLSNL